MIAKFAGLLITACLFGTAMAASLDTEIDSGTIATNAPEPWTPEDGDRIEFDVLRKGKPFGAHIVSFDLLDNGDLQVSTEVELKAGLGPITVFKYELFSLETWRDGKLIALEGQTNDDGQNKFVNASFSDDGLMVQGSAYEGIAHAGIIPSSHWNIQEAFSSSILSTESGEILKTDVSKIGSDSVTVSGETIPTTHYRLKSDLTVDLWYDEENRWVKLRFEARGQEIEYVLRELY